MIIAAGCSPVAHEMIGRVRLQVMALFGPRAIVRPESVMRAKADVRQRPVDL